MSWMLDGKCGAAEISKIEIPLGSSCSTLIHWMMDVRGNLGDWNIKT